jgi:hypothetical protein
MNLLRSAVLSAVAAFATAPAAYAAGGSMHGGGGGFHGGFGGGGFHGGGFHGGGAHFHSGGFRTSMGMHTGMVRGGLRDRDRDRDHRGGRFVNGVWIGAPWYGGYYGDYYGDYDEYGDADSTAAYYNYYCDPASVYYDPDYCTGY